MVEVTPYSVFKTVIMYSAFILLAPIASFFATKILFFEGLLGTSNITSNIWSAVMAVVVLHIALGLFIYRAYFDAGTVKEKLDEKVD